MARGKHRAASATRRAEAAHQVIDRLTGEVADAKLRAKQAEARAARLEGIESLLEAASVKKDVLVAEMTKKLEWWAKVADEDRTRRTDAIVELFGPFWRDTFPNFDDAPVEDRRQFLATRYPAVMLALTAGGGDIVNPHADRVGLVRGSSVSLKFQEHLDDDSRRRFQRAIGLRMGAPDGEAARDLADVLVDLLDAKQAGFSTEEVLDFALGDDRPRRAPSEASPT